MTRPLTSLLALLMLIAICRIGFHEPLPIAGAQSPSETAPAAQDPAPFVPPRRDPARQTPPRRDSGSQGLPGRSQGTEANWQRPFIQVFQLELTVVARDGLSFQKFQVGGKARVMPKGLDELPEVGIGMGGPSDMYGGGDMYGMGMGGEGMEGRSRSIQQLSEEQKSEVQQRVKWQAQADWVRQVLRSGTKLEQAEVERLKTLVREVLKNQYADQLRRQGIELQVVERRLAKLRDQLALRTDAADRVVDFELQRLDLEAGGLGFGPDAQLQPGTELDEMYGGGM